jgi:hypothetical protein
MPPAARPGRCALVRAGAPAGLQPRGRRSCVRSTTCGRSPVGSSPPLRGWPWSRAQGARTRSVVPGELAVDVRSPLPEPAAVAAYDVVSEALTNAAEHAQAPRARARGGTAGDGSVHVSVHDDGIGGGSGRSAGFTYGPSPALRPSPFDAAARAPRRPRPGFVAPGRGVFTWSTRRVRARSRRRGQHSHSTPHQQESEAPGSTSGRRPLSGLPRRRCRGRLVSHRRPLPAKARTVSVERPEMWLGRVWQRWCR